MGEKLEELITKHSLVCHNTGEPTYMSGEITSAPDVTLSYGILDQKTVQWNVIDDDIGSPHGGILIRVGERRNIDKNKRKDDRLCQRQIKKLRQKANYQEMCADDG